MGFLRACAERWNQASKPRHVGTGGLWDNINTPGSKGPILTTYPGASSMEATANYYQAGPNIENYLRVVGYKVQYRGHGPVQIEQPRIVTSEPRGGGWNQIYTKNLGPSTAQKVVQPPAAPVIASATPQQRQRDEIWDGGNTAVIRTPQAHTPSQVYWNQRVPVHEFTTPSVPAHAVQCNVYHPALQTGWEQVYVPEPGMRRDEVGVSPPWLLSTPIRSKTVITEGNSSFRQSMKVSAPKPKKEA